MAYDPFQPVGQRVMASSLGVVIASDQTPVSVMGMGIKTSVLSSISAAEGSVVPFRTDVFGAQYVTLATNLNSTDDSVSATITNTNLNVSGSVAAFISGSSSVITVLKSSSIIAVATGSVVTIPTGNQSVSGTVLVGNTNINIGGSIAGTYTEPAVVVSVTGIPFLFKNNTDTSTLSAVSSARPLPIFFQGGNASVSGAVSISNLPTTQNVSGSVAAFLAGSTNASVITVGTAAPNQSVSGTVQVDNTVTVKSSIAGGIFPISGSVAAVVTNFPTSQNVSGSVVAFPGINPWPVVGVGSIITTTQGSVAVAIISGSVAVATGNSSVQVLNFPANQSVSGTVNTLPLGTIVTSLVSTVPSSVIVGASIFGQLPAGTAPLGSVATLQGTNPWIVTSSIAGGIFPVSGSVAATITNTNLNVSGSVVAFQGGAPWSTTALAGSVMAVSGISFSLSSVVVVGGSIISVVGPGSVITVWQSSSVRTIANVGTNVTSLVSTIPSSVIVGASIFGQLPAGTAPIGSVAVLQGTNPWAVTAVGSIITVWGSPSIVGTYTEDSAHTTADRGLFILGVRNDAVASFAAANLEYSAMATDSAGRTLMKPFAAEEARVEGYHSVVSTSVTTLVAAAGTGLKNYITDIMIANTGATTTLITFRSGGGTSILGYTIAPAGGGSNLIGLATPFMTLANETFGFQATAASSIIYATVKGYKAP